LNIVSNLDFLSSFPQFATVDTEAELRSKEAHYWDQYEAHPSSGRLQLSGSWLA